MQIDNVDVDSIIIRNISEMELFISQHFNNCYITIMPAGEEYLSAIAPSFEFFAMRYIKSYFIPLFSTIPDRDELLNNSIENLACVKMIKKVMQSAQECIQLIHNDILFYNSRGNEHIEHKDRIIQQHTDYLNSFIECVIYKLGEEKELEGKVRELIKTINDIRYQYYGMRTT